MLEWQNISSTHFAETIFTAGEFQINDNLRVSTIVMEQEEGWSWTVDRMTAVDDFDNWIAGDAQTSEQGRRQVEMVLMALGVIDPRERKCVRCNRAIFYEDQVGDGPGEWLDVDPHYEAHDDNDLSACPKGGRHYPAP
jgi:hypothetical protein